MSTPELGDSNTRGFFKQVLTEFEGAVERASESYGEKKPAGAVGREAPKEPGQEPDPDGGAIAEASGPNAST